MALYLTRFLFLPNRENSYEFISCLMENLLVRTLKCVSSKTRAKLSYQQDDTSLYLFNMYTENVITLAKSLFLE